MAAACPTIWEKCQLCGGVDRSCLLVDQQGGDRYQGRQGRVHYQQQHIRGRIAISCLTKKFFTIKLEQTFKELEINK